jgi:hypothetical protein
MPRCPAPAPPKGILTSRIVRGLLPPLVCVLLSSYLVCVYETLWQEGTLDSLVPWVPWPDVAVSPEGPFSISTFALSLLLVGAHRGLARARCGAALHLGLRGGGGEGQRGLALGNRWIYAVDRPLTHATTPPCRFSVPTPAVSGGAALGPSLLWAGARPGCGTVLAAPLRLPQKRHRSHCPACARP